MIINANVVGVSRFTSKKGIPCVTLFVSYPKEKPFPVDGLATMSLFVFDEKCANIPEDILGRDITVIGNFYGNGQFFLESIEV